MHTSVGKKEKAASLARGFSQNTKGRLFSPLIQHNRGLIYAQEMTASSSLIDNSLINNINIQQQHNNNAFLEPASELNSITRYVIILMIIDNIDCLIVVSTITEHVFNITWLNLAFTVECKTPVYKHHHNQV